MLGLCFRAEFYDRASLSENRELGEADEQTVFDYTGCIAENAGNRRGIGDFSETGVEDVVAVVGDEGLAVRFETQLWICAKSFKFFFYYGAGERNDFNRKWKFSEKRDGFGRVGDNDHFLCDGSNDFFAEEGAASPLDQVELGIDLVGAVDGDINFGMVVERSQRDAELTGEFFRSDRGGDADNFQAGLYALA